MYKNPASSAIVEKLELIIIENFYNLEMRQKLLNVQKALISYSAYLFNIITTTPNQSQLNNEQFIADTNTLEQALLQVCHELRSNLLDSHINAIQPRVTFFTLFESAKKYVMLFFTK